MREVQLHRPCARKDVPMNMKNKITAIILSACMLLSLGVTAAFADEGAYGPGGKDAFTPVVDKIEIAWNGDLALDLEDCSFEDWDAAGIDSITIDDTNVVSWIGAIPEDWEMSARFAIDEDFLYIAFNIVDDDVVAVPSSVDPVLDNNYRCYRGGDAFQLGVDFGNLIKWTIENDPDTDMSNTKTVFYSVGYLGDGEDVCVSVRESDDERVLGKGDSININPARTDVDFENLTDTGTKGKTFLTEDGWAAEFCLPLSELYYDFCYKSYNDGWDDMIEMSINVDEDHPLEIGIALYNLDYTAANVGQSVPDIAFGLHSGVEENDKPLVTWTSTTDLATKLSVPYVDGMEFTSPYLLTPEKEVLETLGETVAAPETETTPATETETVVETVVETVIETIPETAAPETAIETLPETTPATETETVVETVAETVIETIPETEPETTPATETETVVETVAETAAETVVETDPETVAPETTISPDVATSAPETEASAADEGCASLVGMGAVSVMAIAAAAVLFKRKEQ